MRSIYRLGELSGIEKYKDVVWAGEYYCNRLESLECLISKISSGIFFVNANDLVDNTSVVLSGMTKWLDLSEPLTKNYSKFDKTGETGFGDPTEVIKSGILARTPQHIDIQIPAPVLERAHAAFMRCSKALLERSDS